MATSHIRRRLPVVLSILFLSSTTLFCSECREEDPFVPSADVSINPQGPITLLVGGFAELTATTTPFGHSVNWASSAPGVASVNQSGRVDALSEGSASVSATVILFASSTSSVVVNVVGPSGAAVILDYMLSAEHQEGDTIALSRITNGRPADPDACDFVHLHTGFDGPGIIIDGTDGPYSDQNPTACGFGRIIALGSGASVMSVGQPHVH